MQVGHCGPIKIGRSADPDRRRSEIQVIAKRYVKILAVLPPEIAEADVHSYFADCRIAGEWFEPTQKILDFIEAIYAHQDEYARDFRFASAWPNERCTDGCPEGAPADVAMFTRLA